MQQADDYKVSVIVPIYNSEDTISACILSILRQSLNDIEVILINDGSKDASGSICDDFAKRDHRIKVIHQENMGRSAARFHGTQVAKGQWLSFVDSDDTLPENALRDMYAVCTDDVDIVLGNGESLKNENRDVIPINEFRHMAVRAEGTIGVPWGSLYRRTIVSPYLFDLPREIVNGEDYIFWLRLVFQTEKSVRIVREKVYNKGEEHTCNNFIWTADYCEKLNDFRMSSIPEEYRRNYLEDTIKDRIVNLCAVAVCQKRNAWKRSNFFLDIEKDMELLKMVFNWKQFLFLHIPSLRIRKLLSSILQRTK